MNYKQKAYNTLHCILLVLTISLGLVTIIGTGGSSDSSTSNGNDNDIIDNANDKDNDIVGGDIINSLGMTFVYIEPGTFMMGSPEDELGRDNDEMQHEVTLTEGYYMQTTPVTQGQWETVMGNNPSIYPDCGDDCPIGNVSWNMAQDFIGQLNALEDTDRYVLPTEAQWEYAARAGSNTAFANGQITNILDDPVLEGMGWYMYNSEGSVQFVAQKDPNAWGLYDMHGNVWEWVADWYGSYPSSAVIDPIAPTPESAIFRVVRGGSYTSLARHCRSANREKFPHDYSGHGVGFRLVRLPDQP